MTLSQHHFQFEEYATENELRPEDLDLLLRARDAAEKAYAPYSNFKVGAAARLVNNEFFTGSNQENASYPAGTCAERSLMATTAQAFPHVGINTMAISYNNANGNSSEPISPCGICRQVLAEYEYRFKHPIRLILAGLTGKVFIMPSASFLLPLSFTADSLKK